MMRLNFHLLMQLLQTPRSSSNCADHSTPPDTETEPEPSDANTELSGDWEIVIVESLGRFARPTIRRFQ